MAGQAVKAVTALLMKMSTNVQLARNTASSKHPTKHRVRASFNVTMDWKQCTIAAKECTSVLIAESALNVYMPIVISAVIMAMELNSGRMKVAAPGELCCVSNR